MQYFVDVFFGWREFYGINRFTIGCRNFVEENRILKGIPLDKIVNLLFTYVSFSIG